MDEPYVTRADDGPVAVLTLNRPARLNPLSDAMLAALTGALDEVAGSATVRAVVLRAEGKAFCAGHDLKEMTAARQSPDGGQAAFQDLFQRCAAMMLTIQRLPQPVIAEVQGIATAAGCQLVASCDLAVAAETARFGVNGVNIGLFCSTPMVALSRVMPRKRVFEMLVTGDMIGAEEARAAGLVNRVVPGESLRQETAALARQVAGKLGAAVRIGKAAFYRQIEMPVADAYAYTGEVMVANMALEDTQEGIAAFLDKRPPRWAVD